MSEHIPVLVHEVLSQFRPIRTDDVLLDATLGLGGHAQAFCEAGGPNVSVIGFDTDTKALQVAKERLGQKENKVTYIHSNFFRLKDALADAGLKNQPLTHILFDLGIGSHQLSDDSRGFSFIGAGEPTMRFDQEGGELPQSQFEPLEYLQRRLNRYPDVSDLILYLSEEDLANLIWKYGEERFSRRIAKFLKEQGQAITSSKELGELIASAYPGKARHTSRIHPATRTFQAFRIAINRELESLEAALPQAVEMVSSGGRIAVISFHSLEDRLVKHFFRSQANPCICPPSQPYCTCERKPSLTVLTKKPITASEEEIQHNPRSRSAKLRVVQKL